MLVKLNYISTQAGPSLYPTHHSCTEVVNNSDEAYSTKPSPTSTPPTSGWPLTGKAGELVLCGVAKLYICTVHCLRSCVMSVLSYSSLHEDIKLDNGIVKRLTDGHSPYPPLPFPLPSPSPSPSSKYLGVLNEKE